MENSTSSIQSSNAINWSTVYSAEMFTIVFISILALLTTIINGFTLYAIYKDPLRCFRTPLTTFISGIILFDFLTGLIVEPCVVAIYAISYVHHGITRQTYLRLVRLVQTFALVTMNSSFLTFLALAVAQLLALARSRIYDRFFTVNSCRIIVAGIWTYAIIFAVIPRFFNISFHAFFVVDLILHNTIVSIVLILIYIATFVYFKAKVAPMLENTEQSLDQAVQQQRGQAPPVQREFLMGTFLITLILILTVFPFTIAFYVWIFQPRGTTEVVLQKYIAIILCENILYLKFLWDPAVLILRVPTYRKSVVIICNGIFPGANAAGVVAYNRQADEENRAEETIVVEDERATTRNDIKT